MVPHRKKKVRKKKKECDSK